MKHGHVLHRPDLEIRQLTKAFADRAVKDQHWMFGVELDRNIGVAPVAEDGCCPGVRVDALKVLGAQ